MYSLYSLQYDSPHTIKSFSCIFKKGKALVQTGVLTVMNVCLLLSLYDSFGGMKDAGKRRIRYMEKRKKQKEIETSSDLLEKNYQDFDLQFREYIGDQTGFVFEDWERFQEFMEKVESDNLCKAVEKLKEREKTLLFARVFGELSFAELGELVGLQPKQAEMAYFFVQV